MRFHDELAEGSGVARSFYTAVAEVRGKGGREREVEAQMLTSLKSLPFTDWGWNTANEEYLFGGRGGEKRKRVEFFHIVPMTMFWSSTEMEPCSATCAHCSPCSCSASRSFAGRHRGEKDNQVISRLVLCSRMKGSE